MVVIRVMIVKVVVRHVTRQCAPNPCLGNNSTRNSSISDCLVELLPTHRGHNCQAFYLFRIKTKIYIKSLYIFISIYSFLIFKYIYIYANVSYRLIKYVFFALFARLRFFPRVCVMFVYVCPCVCLGSVRRRSFSSSMPTCLSAGVVVCSVACLSVCLSICLFACLVACLLGC